MTMVMSDEISAGNFKARCLQLMDDVQSSRKELVITKRGVPVAKLVPVDAAAPDVFGCMRGSAEIHGELLEPAAAAEDWEAVR